MNAALVTIFTLSLTPILCITNDHQRRDSYMSAYLDLQGSSEAPVGVVYAEPLRTYGPPQPKPLVYYGSPAAAVPAILPEHHSYAPVLDILMKLSEKLEFLPKLVAVFLGITKIMLKVVLLKVILKFVVMFCLFFFLPKLEMLDMATEVDTNTASGNNSTGPHTPVDELEEGRLNSMTNFVFESVENPKFLKRYCNPNKLSIKCKMLKMLTKVEGYATVPKLLRMLDLQKILHQ